MDLEFDTGGKRIVPQWIPDLIEPLVQEISTALGFPVYFDKGHYTEVCRNLTMKDGSEDVDGSGDQKREKYPLVWLVMDTDEDISGKIGDDYASINLQIIIATRTEPQYTMDTRKELSFVPILYPIYAELLYQLSRSEDFGQPSILQIAHRKTDRPYWGGEDSKGNTTANLFNDFIDAVQIRNLKLSIIRKCE